MRNRSFLVALASLATALLLNCVCSSSNSEGMAVALQGFSSHRF